MLKKENFELVIMFILGMASIFWCVHVSELSVLTGFIGTFCLIYIEYNCILREDKETKPQWLFWILFVLFLVVWAINLESFPLFENLTFFTCLVFMLFDRIIDFTIKTNPVYLERKDNEYEDRVHAD